MEAGRRGSDIATGSLERSGEVAAEVLHHIRSRRSAEPSFLRPLRTVYLRTRLLLIARWPPTVVRPRRGSRVVTSMTSVESNSVPEVLPSLANSGC